MAEKGKFRQDLLHRIKTYAIELPPLRNREGDIQILSQHYINTLCEKHGLKIKALLPETLEILNQYTWPGNVRELINAIEKSILSEPSLPIIYPMFLPDNIRIHFADHRFAKPEHNQKIEGATENPAASIFSSLFNPGQTPKLKEFRNSAIDKIETLYFKSLLKQTQWNLDQAAELSGVSKSRIYYLIKKYGISKA